MLKAIATRTAQTPPDGRMTLEMKAMLAATVGTILGLVLQVVAVSTPHWVELTLPGQGLYRNSTGRRLVAAYTGLWRLCRVEVVRTVEDGGKVAESEETNCEAHDLFPSEHDIERNHNFDQQHLDYTRTAISFTIIALVLVVIGHCFAFYTLRRPRYIIKRLTALLHFMTAACILVLNEVFSKTTDHEQDSVSGRLPIQAETSYGFSFVLSWIVFVIFLLAGLVFLFLSHKRKAEYADEAEEGLEDEPMHLGRP
ncbi:voltage-dependent calcium channel gamma-1 subunit-like isoform X2 [Babylonia areolata]|uniref:voltage-dependent calcium channel gamma-1 subunit-like isoform X2 n=1 Tax=Babylonia areolata TaxID=304850 RepID=UPI003FD03286